MNPSSDVVYTGEPFHTFGSTIRLEFVKSGHESSLTIHEKRC